MQQPITTHFGTPFNIGCKTKLFSNEILFFEGDVNYTWIHFSSGKQKVIARTLLFVQQIDEAKNFIRVSRKHLVNRKFIAEINRDSVVLSDRTVLPISRRRRGGVFDLSHYLS
jgi:DNA-binding LytR/AlgR family response regulator